MGLFGIILEIPDWATIPALVGAGGAGSVPYWMSRNMGRTTNQAVRIIQEELQPNGGSSIKDHVSDLHDVCHQNQHDIGILTNRIDNLAEHLENVESHVEKFEDRSLEVLQRIAKLEERTKK